MDEGWTRWLLEQFGFAYSSLRNPDILAGRLNAKFDVIVSDQPPGSIEKGYAPGAMPPEFCGGLGSSGAQALREFALAGGTLVFLNESSRYAATALGLPVRDVTRGCPRATTTRPAPC